MECKEVNYHIEKEFDSVLIETLWNVKKEQQKAAQDMTLVLIETLWNVKTAVVKAPVNASRINRNIVECKERHI